MEQKELLENFPWISDWGIPDNTNPHRTELVQRRSDNSDVVHSPLSGCGASAPVHGRGLFLTLSFFNF